MSTTTRYARCSPGVVFAALTDPYTYPEWLVGCRAIRSVDDGWPEPGTRFEHRVGLVGPIAVNDNTESEGVDEPNRLVLQVRFRPFGRGRVTFELTGEGGAGTPLTRIEMEEVPIGMLAPARPVLDPVMAARNRASLNALVAFLNAPEGTSKGEGTPAPEGATGTTSDASVDPDTGELGSVDQEARRQGEVDRSAMSSAQKVAARIQIREAADEQQDDPAERPDTYRE